MAAPQPHEPQPWPLYDLFLDVPHPAASKSCPKPFWIDSPMRDDALMTELRKTIPQVACFAFPEYEQVPGSQPEQDDLNRYDYYATQNKAFQQFIFSLQLGTGIRLHGHVRRYLPPHLVARTRYDVGRRGERALVILTRAAGADMLYAAILKSVESISSQQASMPYHLQAHPEPQKSFLHQLVSHHQHLTQVYAKKPLQEKGIPLVASLGGLEMGNKLLERVDSHRFIFPTSLFLASGESVATHGSSSILPLFRCVGIGNSLRLLSALLSERRVIMVSSSPTRLASCSQAALSMLSQGLLHWQHLYIPVMPPHLWQYLAAPYPYLIGILSSTLPRLERTDGLGEVLIIHLDSNSMETRGIDAAVVDQWIPDMFQSMQGDKGSSTSAAASPIEYLGQDLLEILKEDKKALYGDSTLATMGETAAKATKVVKSTFKKLRDKGRQYLQKNTSMPLSDKEEEEEEEAHEAKSMADDYIFTESCHNASAEEEARVSFTSFFLCMFGNMRWYLSANPGQQLPVLDRERFLQQKRSMGEGEGTPIWPLLKNFCQTQMLEEFAKARIEEVRLQKEATPDAPLFVQCSSYHRQHNVDFGLLNVRKVARQLAQGNKLRNAAVLQSNARRTVMSLTSNKVYEGDYNKTVAQVVEECRESTTILFDVMSVLWLRLRDCKGMQWKHGFQALLILRNLLYHGPVAVIAEATDGLDKIRAIKYYDNMRPQIVSQMRNAATDVYGLLVDRGRLFHIRRICAHRRWRIHNPAPKTSKRTGLTIGVPFRRIHAELHPQAQGTIVRLPTPATASQPVQSQNHQPLAMSPEDTASVFGNMNITSLSPTAAIPQPTVAQPPTNTMPTSQQSFVSQGNPFSVGPQTQAGRVQQVPPAIQPNPNQFDPFAR